MDINIKDMTPEERKAMLMALQAEEDGEKKKRNEYKELVKETVTRNFEEVKKISESLSKLKKVVFEDFSTILSMKAELYGIRENQQSHTFTTDEGVTIIIGHRIIDTFDDTVHTGIAKVRQYIQGVASGEKKEVEMMLDLLLKKDKNGNMKANRVLELKKIAEKINDYDFLDGVKIIEGAYKPAKSSTFIEAYYKDEHGKKVSIPLSISSVDMEEDKNDI